MAKVPLNLIIFLFLTNYCGSEYFEDQPKFLTENGNFIIESALDRNITFRVKGNGYLNVNDLNVLSLVQNGASNSSGASNANIALRLSTLENQMRSSQSAAASRGPNRSLVMRLNRLEGRLNTLGNSSGGLRNGSFSNINRRVRQLEVRLNQLVDRLNADNCSSNPCRNGGDCSNTFGGYMCKCPDAWTGISCEEDVNECAIYAGTTKGCQQSSTCENTPGGFK